MLFFRSGKGARRTPRNRPARPALPALECLEDRCVPTFHEFGPTGEAPTGIALARDGNLWATHANGLPSLHRVRPDGTFLAPVNLPTRGGPTELTAGPASTDPNSVWFSDNFDPRVWRVDTGTLALTAFPTPRLPLGITAAADGNIWFTEPEANKIARLNPATGVVTEFPSPDAGPRALTAGAAGDNAVYATCNSKVARFTTDTLVGSAFAVPAEFVGGLNGYGITAGPDGNVWTTLSDGFYSGSQDQIEGFTPDGTPIGPFPTLTPRFGIEGITCGGDGELYFCGQGGLLGRFNPATLTMDGEATYPTSGSPIFLTAGPPDPATLDMTVWSTESIANKVAQYVIDGMPLRPANGRHPAPHPRPGGEAALLPPTPRAAVGASAPGFPAPQQSKPSARGTSAEQLLLQQPERDILSAVLGSQRVTGEKGHDQVFAGLAGPELPAGQDAEFLL
jgi:streptogramin lyase